MPLAPFTVTALEPAPPTYKSGVFCRASPFGGAGMRSDR